MILFHFLKNDGQMACHLFTVAFAEIENGAF